MFLLDDVSVTQVNGSAWRLDEPIAYEDRGLVYHVPSGYETDFATVPRVIWWLVPTSGDYTPATVIHDALITEWLRRGQVSSRDTDRIFREAMAALGVSLPRRWLMWVGVRWGALGNKKRRAGSWATLPGLLALSLLALPFVLPALAVVPSLVLFGLLERCLP